MSGPFEQHVDQIAALVAQVDALRAELVALRKSAIRAPSPTEWFPASTAPKDGTIIMIWPPSVPGVVTCAAWIDDEAYARKENKRWVRSDEKQYPIRRNTNFANWAPVPAGPEVTP